LTVPPLSPSTSTANIPALNGISQQSNGVVSPSSTPFVKPADLPTSPSLVARKDAANGGYSQRVVLTTYPGQVGINPIPLNWGAPTPEQRGPVVASRQPKSLKVRNAIGAYGGSYSVYRALASASGAVDPNHRPGASPSPPPRRPRLVSSCALARSVTDSTTCAQTSPTPSRRSRSRTTRPGTTRRRSAPWTRTATSRRRSSSRTSTPASTCGRPSR